jgi:hypothetical protein
VKLEINQSIFLSGAVTRYTNNPCAYVISSTFHGLGSSLETRLTLGIHENSRMYAMSRGDHFRFGSVFIKKSNQTKKKNFEKKNRNRVKPTGFGSVRFFMAKTGSNRFGSVFPVLARFSRFFPVLPRVFPVWLGFGLVFSGFLSVSVRFGFFGFLFIKPNRPVFSKI